MFKRICLVWVFLFSQLVNAETIRIALSSEGNPPYSFADVKDPQGIYVDLFTALFEHMPYKVEFVYLSSARIRQAFNDNTIDIECCPLPAWRKGEEGHSVYSDIAFITEDVYVFAKDNKRTVTSIENLPIATIAGYGYLNDDKFKRVDMNSEKGILKVVANMRIGMGIVDRHIALHLIDKHQYGVELGEVHEQAFRPVRVHHNKQHIMPALNNAIFKLNEQGEIAAIFSRYGINNKSN